MYRIHPCKVNKYLVQLQSWSDEETWPPWLRAILSVALVVFLFISGIVFLMVTP